MPKISPRYDQPVQQRPIRQAGFTLVEIMIAIAILAMMMTIVWGSFSISAKTKTRTEESEARYHQLRLALNRLAREISMAYLSKNDAPMTQKPRTMFMGIHNSRLDEVMFSYLGHTPLQENAKECDQAVIKYFPAPDPDNRRITNLMRRETRRLGGERVGEEGPAFILLEDVVELHFSFFDEQANEWKETWNTQQADGQPDRLPLKVKISLTVHDEKGRELKLVTSTRIFMRDPLWFSTEQ